MAKIVSWSIINNEISFIKDIVDYHLSWIDQMYFLDTGSTDGSLEYLYSQAAIDSRIVVEEYPIKYKTQYELNWHEMSDPFPEVIVRNHALEQVSKLNSDWLIQLDCDEVFLSDTRGVIEKNEQAVCIGHSTINPVCKLEEHPLEMRQDHVLYDPHVRIWRNKQEIKYIENPSFKGKQYHCIPTSNGVHLFHHPFVKFIGGPLHFHLHWMYGNKVQSFFLNKGISDKKDIVKEQSFHAYSEYLPVLFWQRRQEWLDR